MRPNFPTLTDISKKNRFFVKTVKSNLKLSKNSIKLYKL